MIFSHIGELNLRDIDIPDNSSINDISFGGFPRGHDLSTQCSDVAVI